MKKIAICISGQFRTFDKVWKENLKILKKDEKYQYFFFCFFWKTKGDTQRILPGHNRTYKNLFLDPFYYYPKKSNQKIFKNKIKKIIPNAKIKISKVSEKNFFYKDNVLRLIQNYPHNKNVAFNSFCLWKSIQICDQMRIDFQKKNKIKFDCVMRIRPDWKLKKNPINKFFKMRNDIIFFDSTSIQNEVKCSASVTDVCIVSKTKIMDIVSKLYERWVKELKKKGWIKYTFGYKESNYKLVFETALFWFLKIKNIKILKNTVGEYGFIYRSSYENSFSKRIFSIKLLTSQIREIPIKIINTTK